MKTSLTRGHLVLIALIVFAAMLMVGGLEFISYLEEAIDLQRLASEAMLDHPAVIALVLLYVVLLSIPFVPGAELGLLLLVVFGVDIAAIVYAATVSGMLLAYAVGRLVPRGRVIAFFDAVRMKKTAQLLSRKLSGEDLDAFAAEISNPWLRKLLRHRCLALAAVINLPGNTLLGGGGGIAMGAGLSRLFSAREFIATVLFAVAPIPVGAVLVAILAQ